MAYPPSDLPTDRTNSTAAIDTHPQDHNNANQAINDIVDELGTDPKGEYASATARLEAIETAVNTHASRHAEDGDDPISPASIGAAAEGHTHEGNIVLIAEDQTIESVKTFENADSDGWIIKGRGADDTQPRFHVSANGKLAWLDASGNVLGFISQSSAGMVIDPFTAPSAPTLTRATVAYDHSFNSVSSGQPVYVPGKFTSGIRIHEGTANLFPAARSVSFDTGWTSGSLNGTYTVSIASGGTLTLSGGATGVVSGGGTLTFSVSFATVTFTPSGTTPARSQLELKPYATHWHVGEGTRNDCDFTVPLTNNLSASEGTVEMYVDIFNNQDASASLARLFHVPYNTDYGIYVNKNATGYEFSIYTSSGVGDTSSTVLFADVPNGWHLFTVTWNSLEAHLMIDGVVKATILTPELPPSLDSNMVVGNWATTSSEKFFNTTIDDLRLSSIARQESDVLEYYTANVTLPRDEYTTYKLAFDSSLSTGTSTNVLINDFIFKADGLFIPNTSVPATPTGGGMLYAESGALKYKGSGGTVTTLGNA